MCNIIKNKKKKKKRNKILISNKITRHNRTKEKETLKIETRSNEQWYNLNIVSHYNNNSYTYQFFIRMRYERTKYKYNPYGGDTAIFFKTTLFYHFKSDTYNTSFIQ